MTTPETNSIIAGTTPGTGSATGTNAVPYIGSRISLISKSDIRYEGTLYTINPKESTVSLSNVRMFGTEGRRGGSEQEIPPRNEIYEYIIFRGSDIKDLTVCEPPPPAPQPSSMFPPLQMATQPPFDAKQKEERISMLDPAKLQAPHGGSAANGPSSSLQQQQQQQLPPPPPQQQQQQQQLPGFNPYAGGFGPYTGVPQPGFNPYGFNPYQGMYAPYGPPGMFGAAPQYPPGMFPGQNPAAAPRPQPPQQQQQQQSQPQQRTGPLPLVSSQPPQQPQVGKSQQPLPSPQPPPPQQPPQSQQRAQPPAAAVTTPAPVSQPAVSSAVTPAQPSPPVSQVASAVTSTKKPDTTPAASVAPVVATTTPAAPVSTAPQVVSVPPPTASLPTAPSAAPTSVSMATEISEQQPQQQEQMVSSGAQPTSDHVEYERRHGGGGGGGGGGHRYHHWRGGRGGRPSSSSAFAPNKTRFTEDFDFETANARFDKEKLLEEITQEGGSKPAVPIGAAYSKTTSFFDNISCETLERTHDDHDGRPRSYRGQDSEHRRNDSETFGRYQGPRYHGGGGGGGYRGGRGGYRGGRGGGPQHQQLQSQQPQPQQQQFHRHTHGGARFHSNNINTQNANDMKENRPATTKTSNE